MPNFYRHIARARIQKSSCWPKSDLIDRHRMIRKRFYQRVVLVIKYFHLIIIWSCCKNVTLKRKKLFFGLKINARNWLFVYNLGLKHFLPAFNAVFWISHILISQNNKAIVSDCETVENRIHFFNWILQTYCHI